MPHLWEAERVIEPELALKLIVEQFPELNAKKIQQLGVGWDNTAFMVDKRLIFRFPRREIAVQLIEEEYFFLPKLASLLSLPIPCPQWKGSPSAYFPWPFIGYSMLNGFTACHVNLSEEARCSLTGSIAIFLQHLHSISLLEFSKASLFSTHLSRIDGTIMNAKIKKNLEELSHLGLLENQKKLEKAIENSQNFNPPKSSSIVHGDFYVRHLLIDKKHQLTGIIDWGDVHIGDPAIDLAIAHSFLPLEAHELFQKTYGEISEDTWQLARLRAIVSGTYQILFGHHSNDLNIKREGLRTLHVISSAF